MLLDEPVWTLQVSPNHTQAICANEIVDVQVRLMLVATITGVSSIERQ